jgi:hypothetical protein
MTLVEVMFHILQQGPIKGTPSFQTHNQAIKNISKDINPMANKVQTQKHKEPKEKTRRTKVDVNVAKKELVKKMNMIIESSLSYNSEISLPPQKNNFICARGCT